ncbi:hypothetical protein WOLCODRAFT_166301 [Wolfiporia cocos MD-104 SS10]|uniref:DUF6533 domain-containing protein n=1 Tax=Wolfiporia cocos (strain MD-104) TaxID=742152 RepID=A0A2H3J6X2_WOLCO|nr:hypothetical protein WOLCODRAFT_166301 [Wolfiporia cocos MD-104 SS10]
MSEQAARFSFIIPFKSLCAAFTFILYDTVLNIADEVEYIWKGPRSWTKWAYAFIRHMPYLAQGGMTVLFAHMYSTHLWTQKQCVAWWVYQASVFEGLLIAVEGVFILRICALYSYHRVLTSGILVLYFVEIAAMITVLAVATPVMQFNPECLIVKTPPIFATYWIISLAFETFLFGLIIVKFFTSVSRQLGRRSILFVLVRDGMWAYAIIFGLTCFAQPTAGIFRTGLEHDLNMDSV